MRRTPWATYLWPGLPQVWTRGSWSALLLATAAATLLNLAMIGTLVWCELIAPDVRTALWGTLGGVWGVAALVSFVWGRWLKASEQTDPAAEPFMTALEYYLKGNWFQAERALGRLLRKNARDLEARLMLAALLRHTGRFDEAGRQLDRLQRIEDAVKWELEIHRERKLLAKAAAHDAAARVKHAA